MPKENLFRVRGYDIQLSWNPAGEIRVAAVENRNVLEGFDSKNVVSHSDIDRLVAILRRAQKQTFKLTLLEAWLKSAKLTSMVDSFAPISELNLVDKVKKVPCSGPVAKDEDVPGFAASYVYLREKIALLPSTMRAARQAKRQSDGSYPEGTVEAFERYMLSDIYVLNQRFDNFVEVVLISSLFGRITFKYEDVVVDYTPNFLSYNHIHDIKSDWFNENCYWADIERSVEDLKEAYLTRNDNNLLPTDAYAEQKIIKRLHTLYKGPTDSDISGFRALDIDWHATTLGKNNFEVAGMSNEQVKGKVAFVNWENEPLHLIEGPSADINSPDEHTGKFMKGWQEEDPASSWILEEYSFAPVWAKPNQVVTLKV